MHRVSFCTNTGRIMRYNVWYYKIYNVCIRNFNEKHTSLTCVTATVAILLYNRSINLIFIMDFVVITLGWKIVNI